MAVVGTEADALRLRFEGYIHSRLEEDEPHGGLGLDLSEGPFQIEVDVVGGEIRWRSTRSRFSVIVDPASRRARALDPERGVATELDLSPRERRRVAACLSPPRPAEIGNTRLTGRDATLKVDGAQVAVRLGDVPGLSARNGRAARELLLPWDVEGASAGEVPLDLRLERAGRPLLTLRAVSIGKRPGSAPEAERRAAGTVDLATLLEGGAPARVREREVARPAAAPLISASCCWVSTRSRW